MKSIPKLLSKTKLLRGFRCLKYIYLTIHKPSLEAPLTPDIQALFAQGTEVGIAARTYFPGGVLIDNLPWDFAGAVANTQQKIAAGVTTLYEAAFLYNGCYARADILQYSPITKRWKIYEVKSSTKVKPEHITDLGLQAWVMAKSGLPIEQLNVMYLNPHCRYPDLSNLFATQEVTEEIRTLYLGIHPKVHEILTTLHHQIEPPIDIGPHCHFPTECTFISTCWQAKAIQPLSVFNLPGIKQRKWELYTQGILALDDSRLTDLTPLQERVVEAYKSGKRFIEREGIQQALAQWQFPLIFLDFETINPAIPRYVGCGPYHQVPFQFSVHTWTHPEAVITHQAHLHTDASDPRPHLIPALLKACGEQGSIVAYFGQFESDRIKELADFSPSHKEALLRLTERIVDPLPILKDFVYDNNFAGSFSLKKVAPALLGEEQSYEGMIVANGGDAQRAFEKLISPAISNTEKAALEQALLAYCEKDTFVMVELVKWLFTQSK